MRKKIFLLLIITICLFGIFNTVYASEYDDPEAYLCTNRKINELLSKARNIKANYELKTNEDGGKYFRIKISGLTKDLILNLNDLNYSYEQYGDTFYTLDNIPSTGGNYVLKFYGGLEHACAEQFITRKNIKIPKYNLYSELDQCVEYEEFPLCAKYYEGEIKSSFDFNEQLQKWIDDNKVEYEIVEQSFFDKIRNYIEDNQLLVAIVSIVIIAIIIIIIILKLYKRSKRQKIKY